MILSKKYLSWNNSQIFAEPLLAQKLKKLFVVSFFKIKHFNAYIIIFTLIIFSTLYNMISVRTLYFKKAIRVVQTKQNTSIIIFCLTVSDVLDTRTAHVC